MAAAGAFTMAAFTETYTAADAICDAMDRAWEDRPETKALRARQDADRAAVRAARAAAPTVRPMGSDDNLLDGIDRLNRQYGI